VFIPASASIKVMVGCSEGQRSIRENQESRNVQCLCLKYK
jgi:hypothetical protein